MSAPTRTRNTSVPVVGVPASPAMPADVQALLHRLRLPHIRRHAPDVIATAKAQRWGPVEVLRALLTEEAAGRERSALATRRAAAGFPTGKTFDAWNPGASSIPAPTQQALRGLEWVHRRENLVLAGPSGTGKTFLLEALHPRRLSRLAGSFPVGYSRDSTDHPPESIAHLIVLLHNGPLSPGRLGGRPTPIATVVPGRGPPPQLPRDPGQPRWTEIEVLIITGVTNARTEAANTGIKNIKRTGRGFRNQDNYRTRILLTSAAKRAARTLNSAPLHAQPRRAGFGGLSPAARDAQCNDLERA